MCELSGQWVAQKVRLERPLNRIESRFSAISLICLRSSASSSLSFQHRSGAGRIIAFGFAMSSRLFAFTSRRFLVSLCTH